MNANPSVEWLDWPAPANIRACFTTRIGGESAEPYGSFNMGQHVGDEPDNVLLNRQRLYQFVGQKDIAWLNQVHGTQVVDIAHLGKDPVDADASISLDIHRACCVMTADCLPVFICDKSGSFVAVIHAGWRGLLNGVVQNTLLQLNLPLSSQPKNILAYLGPAISQSAFEVGDDVRSAFIAKDPHHATFFIPATLDGACSLSSLSAIQGKWMADLYGLARYGLSKVGVNDVFGGDYCTYNDSERFFSYRRDGVTGRMANLIWMEEI